MTVGHYAKSAGDHDPPDCRHGRPSPGIPEFVPPAGGSPVGTPVAVSAGRYVPSQGAWFHGGIPQRSAKAVRSHDVPRHHSRRYIWDVGSPGNWMLHRVQREQVSPKIPRLWCPKTFGSWTRATAGGGFSVGVGSGRQKQLRSIRVAGSPGAAMRRLIQRGRSLGVRGVGTGSVAQQQLHHLRLVQCQVQWA